MTTTPASSTPEEGIVPNNVDTKKYLDKKKDGIIEYDLERYPFPSLITDILLNENKEKLSLDRIHEKPEAQQSHVLTFAADQNLYFHRQYYDSPKLESDVLPLYRKFVADVIAPLFLDDVLVVQRKPTFRVHLPNNTAVPSDVGGDPERPGMHCDADYNHPECEVNFWVPFTSTNSHNTIWLESEPNKGDFRAMLARPGQCLNFWGAKCRHYNELNKEEPVRTRVSFDFRVMNKSDWDAIPAEWFQQHTTTVQAKMKLVIGSYYMLYHKETGDYTD